jgi:two-component system cell cycle response regulator
LFGVDALIFQRDLDLQAVANGKKIQITFSAGISAWRKGLSMKDWMDETDQLLYQAKEEGRDRCVAWSSRLK